MKYLKRFFAKYFYPWEMWYLKESERNEVLQEAYERELNKRQDAEETIKILKARED